MRRPGTSGPQRRDDWRTWEWSESPYVHALAWCRGHYKLNLDGTIDRTKRIAGIGAPDTAIDIPAFVEGMNVAQANNWTISGEWSTSDGKFQTLLAMLQAGGGEPISRGAQISVMVNAPRVATYTYTRDDLIGQAEIRPLTPRRERKNTIIPRYKSEANGWQYVPAGEVTSSVYRDEDRGEPRSLEIEYTHVRSAKQAGQLAAYDLANLREGLTATLPSRVHLMHVHPGDCITVDVPELALAGQKFVVRRATMNHQAASVTLELRSESDGKHAWALGQAAQPAPSPSLSAVDPKYVPPPAPGDWTVVPKPPGGGGISQPIVIIELPIETTDIIAVIIKHGPSAAGPWTDGYEGSPRPDGRYEIAGLTPGQTYCFSLQYVAKNGAKSDPDIKCGIVAGDLTAGNVIPTAPTIVSIRNDIEAAFGDIFDVSELLADARTQLDAQGAEIAAARNGEATLSARIAQVNQARIDGDEANALAISGVAARTANTEADIIDLENALANETTARAEAVSQLTARSTHRPNLIDNPSGAADFRAWIKEGSPASYVDDDRLAGRIFVVYGYMVSQVYPAAAGDQHSLGFVASPLGDGGHVRLQYVTPGGFVDAAPVPSGAGGYDVRRRSTAPSTAPAGATGFRVVVVPPSGGVLPVWAIKVNFGSVATDFSDDYSGTVLAATVTEQSLAIIDLENQQAIASWRIKSEASGSKPAIIEAVSALGGAYVAFGAEQIYFGENTVLDNATDTIQTITGGRIRVTAWGAPFGLYGDLLEWWGPTGIALSSMTSGNGYSGRMISPPYVFDNVVAGASGSAAARKESFSNSFAMGNTWSTVEVFTPVGVPSSPFVSANIEWQGPPSVSDTSVWNGEMRLVEAATGTVVAAPQAFSITHNNEPFAVALSGAGVSAGAVQYALQARRTSGSNTVTAVGFAINFDAYQRL